MPTANKLLTELIDNTNSRITVPSGGINYYNNQITVPSNGINFGTTTGGTGTVTSGVMNDYEEGTWTPTGTDVSGGSGTYVKIGKFVYCQVYTTTTASAAADLTVSGLPFNVVGFTVNTAVENTCILYDDDAWLAAFISDNSDKVEIRASAPLNGATQANPTIRGSFSYVTDV